MAKASEPQPVTAKARYDLLAAERLPFLNRARDAAKLTIPGLMPPEGHSGTSSLPQPYQSAGAEGVSNLAAKLLLALQPPGTSFFRLTMDDFLVNQLKETTGGETEGASAREAYEEALGKIERAVTNRMEQSGSRPVHVECFEHLIVCGNGLLQVLDDATENFYPLDRYVVKRDLEGTVLEIIVKETLARVALPLRVQLHILTAAKVNPSESSKNENEKNVDLYTWIKRKPSGSWMVQQEVEGSTVEGSQGTYPKDKCAWIPLRWSRVAGEDYGRGHCEKYSGDLISCETLTEAVVGFAAQAAKILWMVDETGTTDKETVAKSRTGDVVNGRAKDVSVLMLEKLADFQVAERVLSKVEKRLERAFLLTSSVQRDAERVTAEEIRAMIGELEQTLGGVYAILGEEFQRPLVIRIMHQMTKRRELPRLPDNVVSPQIVTGMDGLGRASDLQRLNAFVNDLATQVGPEPVAEYLQMGEFMRRKGTALNIPSLEGLIRTEQDVATRRAQAQQSALMEKLGPAGIKAMSDQAQSAGQSPPGTPAAA